MNRLRTPLFVAALAVLVLILLVELGARLLLGGRDAGAALPGQAAALGVTVPAHATTPPGLGIGYLALIDVILLFTVALMAVGLVVPPRVHGRVQAPATLVFALLLVIAAIVLLVAAIGRLVLMVTLFFAVPFGTLAYLIGFGFFPRGRATALLALLMLLKLAFAALMLAAQPRFARNKGLVALALTSLLADLVVGVLHAVVPGVLVSITDALAAVILAAVAIVWAVVLLVGAVPGIVRSLRVPRSVGA